MWHMLNQRLEHTPLVFLLILILLVLSFVLCHPFLFLTSTGIFHFIPIISQILLNISLPLFIHLLATPFNRLGQTWILWIVFPCHGIHYVRFCLGFLLYTCCTFHSQPSTGWCWCNQGLDSAKTHQIIYIWVDHIICTLAMICSQSEKISTTWWAWVGPLWIKYCKKGRVNAGNLSWPWLYLPLFILPWPVYTISKPSESSLSPSCQSWILWPHLEPACVLAMHSQTPQLPCISLMHS